MVKQEQLSPRGTASSQTENLSSQDSATSRSEFGTNHYSSSQFSFNSESRNKAHVMKRLKTLTRSHRPHASCSGWQHHKGYPWHTCATRTFHIISRRFNHSGKKLLSAQNMFKNGKCTVNLVHNCGYNCVNAFFCSVMFSFLESVSSYKSPFKNRMEPAVCVTISRHMT